MTIYQQATGSLTQVSISPMVSLTIKKLLVVLLLHLPTVINDNHQLAENKPKKTKV